MTTLAFGQMAYFVAKSLAAYGGGDGMALDRAPPLAGSRVLEAPLALHGLALALLLAAVLLARAIGASRFGRALRAARENPAPAAALGFDVRGLRLAAYVGAGACAASPAGCSRPPSASSAPRSWTGASPASFW